MIIINFAHPLTPLHLTQVRAIVGLDIDRVVDVPTQVDFSLPIMPQVVEFVNATGISGRDWQTMALVVNPPGFSFLAVALATELHGRCGYFPAHIRMRPVPDAAIRQFEVAEVVDMQKVREQARVRREHADETEWRK